MFIRANPLQRKRRQGGPGGVAASVIEAVVLVRLRLLEHYLVAVDHVDALQTVDGCGLTANQLTVDGVDVDGLSGNSNLVD